MACGPHTTDCTAPHRTRAALAPAALPCAQGVGAICSRRAAELYGLDVLEEGIQDVKDNVTRFIVLSRWGKSKLGRGREGLTRSSFGLIVTAGFAAARRRRLGPGKAARTGPDWWCAMTIRAKGAG